MIGAAGLIRFVRLRLCLLAGASVFTGYVLRGNGLGWPGLWAVSGALLLAAGCSGLNQVQERGRDALMRRTANRPLPSGELGLKAGLLLAGGLISTGLGLLGLAGAYPLLLGALILIAYNAVYTPLKPVTPYCLLIGGLCGAAGPLIGYAAAGGEPLSFVPLSLGCVIYLWQMPHFWLLRQREAADYALAGFATAAAPHNFRIAIWLLALLGCMGLCALAAFAGLWQYWLAGLTVFGLSALGFAFARSCPGGGYAALNLGLTLYLAGLSFCALARLT